MRPRRRPKSVLVEVLRGDVLGFVLTGVGASQALHRFGLRLGRPVGIAALAAEDFPALSRNIIMESLYIQLLSKTQYL